MKKGVQLPLDDLLDDVVGLARSPWPAPRRCAARARASSDGNSSRTRNRGAAGLAMCSAMSFTSCRNSSVLATKSVSQFTSTRTPDRVVEVDVAVDQALVRRPARAFLQPAPAPSPAAGRRRARSRRRSRPARSCSPSCPRRSPRAAPSPVAAVMSAHAGPSDAAASTATGSSPRRARRGRLGDDLRLGRRLDLGDLGDDAAPRPAIGSGSNTVRRGDLGRHLGRLAPRGSSALARLRGHLLHQIVLRPCRGPRASASAITRRPG